LRSDSVAKLARTAAAALALFILGILPVAPLLSPGDTVYRDSIGPGYASMASFFRDEPNPWAWNRYQYCGQPAQSVYLPVVPYTVAALSHLLPFNDIVHANRFVFLVAASLVPFTWFLFAVRFSGAPGWSFAAMLCFALLSPQYGLFQAIDQDRGLAYLPWRLQVVVKYGEGPHSLGLALAPLALWALDRARLAPSSGRALVAALLYATVCLTNWVAALTLAILTVLFISSAWSRRPEERLNLIWAVACLLLAYVLSAFWLTFDLIGTTLWNWPADAFGYRFGWLQKLLTGVGFLGLAGLVAVGRRLGASGYALFLSLSALLFGVLVSGFYTAGINVIPEARRYAIEFALFFWLWLMEVLRLVTDRWPRWRLPAVTLAAAVIVVLGHGQLRSLVRLDQDKLRPVPRDSTVEYRVGEWLARQGVTGRVFVSGGTRFRLNSWFRIPQVGGVFESGLDNRVPLHMTYQIRTAIGSEPGESGLDALTQLQVMGVEYLVIHGPKSREHYRDFREPQRMESLLDAAHRDGDDVIYRVPFRSLAHQIREDEIVTGYAGGAPHTIRPLAEAVIDQRRPLLRVEFSGSSRATISGPVRRDSPVAFLMSHHPGWRAPQGGQAIAIGKDALGFMILRPVLESVPVELEFGPTPEQQASAGLSLVSALFCAAAVAVKVRRGPAAWQTRIRR